MSQENVEMVRRVFDAFEQGGLEAGLPFFAPDLTWEIAEDEPDATTVHGHDGLRALVAGWLEAFDELHIEPEEFIDAGDAVVIPYWARGRLRDSGEVRAPETWVFWLRNGKVVQVREYRHKADALEAVGLSE